MSHQEQKFNIGDHVIYMGKEYEVYAFWGGHFHPDVQYPYWIRHNDSHTVASNSELQTLVQFKIGDIVKINDKLSFFHERIAEIVEIEGEFMELEPLCHTFHGYIHKSRLIKLNKPKFKVGDKINAIIDGENITVEITGIRENYQGFYYTVTTSTFDCPVSKYELMTEKYLLASQIKSFKKGEEVWVRAKIHDEEPDSDGDIHILRKVEGDDNAHTYVKMSEVFRKQDIPGVEKNV